MSDQATPVRKFKALQGKGKRIYCRGGDVHFKLGDVYETSDLREINCILRASQVVEITDGEGAEAGKADQKPAQGTGTTAADTKADEDMTKWNRERLEKKAMELGYTEEEVAEAKNKADLQEMIERKKVSAEAEAKLEENKKLLAERGVDTTPEMTAEEIAQLVVDTQGA